MRLISLGFGLIISLLASSLQASPLGTRGTFALTVTPGSRGEVEYEGRGSVLIDLPVRVSETHALVGKNEMTFYRIEPGTGKTTSVASRGIPTDIAVPSGSRLRLAAYTLNNQRLGPGHYRVDVAIEFNWRDFSAWKDGDSLPPLRPLGSLQGSTEFEVAPTAP